MARVAGLVAGNEAIGEVLCGEKPLIGLFEAVTVGLHGVAGEAEHGLLGVMDVLARTHPEQECWERNDHHAGEYEAQGLRAPPRANQQQAGQQDGEPGGHALEK
jgi:hypothetical protein